MPSRKAIRDAIKAHITTAYTGEVFSGRIQDNYTSALREHVDIFFEEGATVEEGSLSTHEARLTIRISKMTAVTERAESADDELDHIADLIESTLFDDLGGLADGPLDELVHGIVREGFEYSERGESETDRLNLLILIKY